MKVATTTLALAAAISLAACAVKDKNADSIRADTISPGPRPEMAPPSDVVPATASSTPERAADSAATPPAAAPRRRTTTKPAAKPDTSHLGYDRAIQPKLDKAHTLPRVP